MDITSTTKSGTDQFNAFLSNFKDLAIKEKAANFYHVDIVADAYNAGFNDGQKSGKQEFVEDLIKKRSEKFSHMATQVYILTQVAISHLKNEGYKSKKFFINIAHENPKAIIAVDGQMLLDDDFVKIAYAKLRELKTIFNRLFNCTFDIGLVSYDDLDEQSLIEDLYEYSELIE